MSDFASYNDVEFVCCSVLRRELTAVLDRLGVKASIDAFDSQLHMRPAEMQETLESRVQGYLEAGRRVLLVCGDCSPGMHELAEMPAVVRVPGCNCVGVLLGRDGRRSLLHEGAFALLPEWTERWREIFPGLLGLPENEVKRVMQENHRLLVYLDTGLVAPPTDALMACATWFGLPYEVREVSLGLFTDTIKHCLRRLDDV